MKLPGFALEAYFATWEFKAKHHLTASDAQTSTIADLLDLAEAERPGARDEFLNLPLSYTPTWGSDELRAAVAANYRGLTADDVLAFAGAEEGMFWCLQALLGPGDHAVVTVPNYQAMEAVPLATGAAVTGVPLWPGDASPAPGQGGESATLGWGGASPAGGAPWRLDVDAIRAALRPNTRVVAVNLPNNPTGYLPDPQTWAELAALCDQRGVHLFSDEVYRGIEADPARTLPAAVEIAERGISLDVTSKSLGLPGLRVGWIACRDRELLRRLESRKHWTSICNATPSEWLATVALRNAATLRSRTRDLIATNRPVFDAFFACHPGLFEWQAPDGGCVAFPRYLGADGVEAFCADLVETAGVLLLPASVYASQLGPVPADRFRIGVGRRDPEPALAALSEFLQSRAATR